MAKPPEPARLGLLGSDLTEQGSVSGWLGVYNITVAHEKDWDSSGSDRDRNVERVYAVVCMSNCTLF